MSARERVHERLAEAGLSHQRYIDVEDGSKRSYDHDTQFDTPPDGNYAIYAKPTDGLVLVDIDDYNDLEDKSGLAALADLPATLEQESAHGGTHRLYRVGATDDGRLVANVLDSVFGTMNPTPSWGEVRVANQYIVGAGSELDDGCRYGVQADREIATVSASDLVDVIAADPRMERKDIDETSADDVDETVEVPESVDERLEHALDNDEKLNRLWRGDYSDYGGDRSRAEAALACKLAFWVGKDKRIIADLLDQANTQKWAQREDDSYRESVLSAVDVQSDVFEPRSPKPKSEAAEAADSAAETDGGTATDDTTAGTERAEKSLQEQVRDHVLVPLDPPEESSVDPVDMGVALDRFASLLMDEYSFVRPRSDVRGWRDTLYNYVAEEGIYEPHGKSFIARESERLLGAVATNQRVKEVTEKIARQNQKKPGELQTQPNRLVVGNGILDLHDGTLSEYTDEEYHRTKIDVSYRPDAEPDFIDDFVNDVTRDDADTLYRAIAHCLYKEYVSEKAIMLLGDGQNGKSVFLSLVEEFLGTPNVSHRALQDFDDNDYAANNLEGKLANIHPDMGDERVTDLGTFKKLTGRDVMTADVKYERPITFENHATLLFAANRMPVLDEDTHALWRRWVYVNFPFRYDDDDPDAKDETPKRVLMRKLTAEEELEGLLARCVQEIEEWWQGRAWYPDVPSPDEVREKMKRASEPVFDFAAVCLEDADEDEWLRKDEVRQAYRDYARDEGLPAIPENQFGEKLVNLRDYTIESSRRRTEGERVRVYTGVQWTSRGRQVVGMDQPDDNDQQTDLGDAEDTRAAIRDELKQTANGLREPVLIAQLSKYNNISPEKAQETIDTLAEKGQLISRDGGRIRLK